MVETLGLVFIVMWFYVCEHPKPGSVSGFKCLGRWGHGLVSFQQTGGVGDQTRDPWVQYDVFLVVEMKL